MHFCILVSALCVLNSPGGLEQDRCVPGQAIVKLDQSLRGRVAPVLVDGVVQVGTPELDDVLRQLGMSSFEPLVRCPIPVAVESGADMLYLVSFDPAHDVSDATALLQATGLVEHACPNALLPVAGAADGIPNDPRYAEQWHLPRIRAPRAWDVAQGDSAVVIAVIDDGLVWTHEDIRSNVWVNVPEDINHNGQFDTLPAPDGDLDGVDQDGNGYTDDVIGFDFLHGDPNPRAEGTDDHGTSCWGVANAATDNDTGVASPPWNVRGMALRCGGGGSISLGAAIAAIYYGIGEGAWVYSMSFGSSTQYLPLRNACQDLWSSGGLSVASAGSNDSVRKYPAAFENVVAVTASDHRDYKAPFGAYGTWVDVCAPGVEMLTTSRSAYMLYSGTSFSTALAAGVLAWYKSAYPGITNDSALALLYNLCDSMPDPLYLQGLLGHGRIAMVDSGSVGMEGMENTEVRKGRASATVVGGALWLAPASSLKHHASSILADASGRNVARLRPGLNDVSGLAPGVYFVRGASSVTRLAIVR